MNFLSDTLAPRTSGNLASLLDERSFSTEADANAERLQELGTQVAKMAHDLNNLLSPILMSLEIFRPHLGDASHLVLLDIAKKSTLRAADLVKQVLAFSRGADTERSEIDPSALIREIGDFTQATFPGSIGIRVEAPEALPRITGSPTQLHRALLNLSVNARDAMPEGGTLTLRASTANTKTGRYVLFEVTDSGSGIPERIREKIFDPFFTTKAPGKGTGLGLASVRTIVESHDGVLSLQTELGKGTTFHLLIPVAESATTNTAANTELRIVAA
ncbi:MAG: ATP-binding protein [Chthoniobacter sp.]|uniref:two-component system sensor histidine kinase NtrB n=1 Tax=Chthoniobacter sp. TaxID=2510640 RepID=UPI0032A36B2B